ncbi:MAG: ribonuclease HIII [Euryarchaeota archaeon]|nr:ribonuclease HIII [Euryarchaeota archaeon]
MTAPVLPGKGFSDFRAYLERVGFAFEDRPHQVFLARSGKLVVSLYESGKVVIAGKDRRLEREVRWYLEKLGAKGEPSPARLEAVRGRLRVGTDEAGKGDYFGPLVVAAVLLGPGAEERMRVLGVKDSKRMSDGRVAELAPLVRRAAGAGRWEVLRIDPPTYNRLHEEMGDQNAVLAWAHARLIGNLLAAHPDCRLAVVDEFSAASLRRALLGRGRDIEVVQSPGGERDQAVAAASVLARAEFLERLEALGAQFGMEFPKGASGVEGAARELLRAGGEGRLGLVAKLHFRTTQKVLGP